MRKTKSFYKRFIEKIGPQNENGCRLWMGAQGDGKYGNFGISAGITISAHRFSYMIFVGPIPDRKLVLHKCDVKGCVNPDHLFLGSHKDNAQDMVSKRRDCRGAKQWASKLTELQVREILSSSETCIDLAERYEVSKQQISRIRNGLRWNHVYRTLAEQEAKEVLKQEAELYR